MPTPNRRELRLSDVYILSLVFGALWFLVISFQIVHTALLRSSVQYITTEIQMLKEERRDTVTKTSRDLSEIKSWIELHIEKKAAVKNLPPELAPPEN